MKLSYDQQDALAPILIDDNSWKALMFLLREVESDFKNKVLSYNLDDKAGDRGLSIVKARAEGVSRFLRNFEMTRDKLVKQ